MWSLNPGPCTSLSQLDKMLPVFMMAGAVPFVSLSISEERHNLVEVQAERELNIDKNTERALMDVTAA